MAELDMELREVGYRSKDYELSVLEGGLQILSDLYAILGRQLHDEVGEVVTAVYVGNEISSELQELIYA